MQKLFTSPYLIPLLAGIAWSIAISRPEAAELRAGDVLVADPDFVHFVMTGDMDAMRPAIWKIDPNSGEREVVTSKERGGGVPLVSAIGVVVDGLGRMTVADVYGQALLSVDAGSGDRTYLSSHSIGSGFDYHTISALALDPDDSLVVLDHLSGSIFRVDPDSGDRTLISNSTRGQGPELFHPSTVAVDRFGTVWTTALDANLNPALIRVDPVSGDRLAVSGWGIGDGPEFFSVIQDIQFLGDQAFVAGPGYIHKVDLANGSRTDVSTLDPWNDGYMFAIDSAPNGKWYGIDESQGTVHRLDLVDRRYTLLSGNTPEWGPRIWQPQDIFVVVPEPGSAAQIAIAILLTSKICRRRRR